MRPGEPLRALLVEDDPNDADLMTRALTRGGFSPRVQRVHTEAALNDAVDAPWDVVLSDFEMPGFDGLRAFEILRDRCPEVPFLFVSGALGEERAVAAMRAGARDYLLKSQLDRLAVAVRREVTAAAERRARRLADESEARHRRVLGLAVEASGVGVFEEHGSELFLSERCRDLLGVGSEAITSVVPWLLPRVHPEDRGAFAKAWTPFHRREAARLVGEYRFRLTDGAWRFVRLTLQWFGEAHVVGVVEDLTTRHQLEAELRQSQKMEAVGRLAGGIAHDFNNLLTAILGFAGFLVDDPSLSTSAVADLDQIVRAAHSAEALTRQLLAFSRRQTIAPQTVELNSIVRDAERLLTRLLPPQVTLVLDLESTSGRVRLDPSALGQVLVNLVVNARDAMPNGGTVRVSTRSVVLDASHPEVVAGRLQPGPHCSLSVGDDGVGMDQDTLQHLFEPFFTTKGVGKGTGLGLSTCYGIVRQAEGSIAVWSEVGRGARFDVHFPLSPDPVTHPAPAAQTRPPETNRTVLVVDDDPQLCRLIVRSLRRDGHQTLVADGGRAALELEAATPGPIHLLVTDMLLPDLDGVSLAHAFSARRPEAAVLFTTGFSEEGGLQATGPVLAKPFSIEDLLRHVHAALTTPRTHGRSRP